jgi:hypothetical protein
MEAKKIIPIEDKKIKLEFCNFGFSDFDVNGNKVHYFIVKKTVFNQQSTVSVVYTDFTNINLYNIDKSKYDIVNFDIFDKIIVKNNDYNNVESLNDFLK